MEVEGGNSKRLNSTIEEHKSRGSLCWLVVFYFRDPSVSGSNSNSSSRHSDTRRPRKVECESTFRETKVRVEEWEFLSHNLYIMEVRDINGLKCLSCDIWDLLSGIFQFSSPTFVN